MAFSLYHSLFTDEIEHMHGFQVLKSGKKYIAYLDYCGIPIWVRLYKKGTILSILVFAVPLFESRKGKKLVFRVSSYSVRVCS